MSIFSIALYGQHIEFAGGVNQNNFFDNEYNGGAYHSEYTSGNGYSAYIGIENVKIDWLTMRFTLECVKYSGKLETSSGSMAGQETIVADVEKSVLSIGMFPVNFNILKKIDLNAGILVGRLLNEKFRGTISGWNFTEPPPNINHWEYDLQERYDRFSSKTYVGLKVRIAYDFRLTETLFVSPQYSYYYGIFNEFGYSSHATKSMKHSLSIGLEKKIK